MDPKEQYRFDQLYQKHLTALTLQGKADRTIDAYARAVRRVAEFADRCPDDLTPDELKAFFSGLIDSHSWSTVKLDLNGLRFFYRHTVNRDLPWLDIVRPPKAQSLPDILTTAELAAIIHRTNDQRLQAFWFVTYSLGLRLAEAINLEVGDIDRARMLVHVRHGKGRKDRFVILPKLTLRVLQRLWLSHRHPSLLFPSRAAANQAHKTIHRATVQRAFKRICRQCAIHKHVSIHSLRHSYATHLIEAGLNLKSLQQQLGHADPQTTARYVRLTDKSTENTTTLINTTIDLLAAALRQQVSS